MTEHRVGKVKHGEGGWGEGWGGHMEGRMQGRQEEGMTTWRTAAVSSQAEPT